MGWIQAGFCVLPGINCCNKGCWTQGQSLVYLQVKTPILDLTLEDWSCPFLLHPHQEVIWGLKTCPASHQNGASIHGGALPMLDHHVFGGTIVVCSIRFGISFFSTGHKTVDPCLQKQIQILQQAHVHIRTSTIWRSLHIFVNILVYIWINFLLFYFGLELET